MLWRDEYFGRGTPGLGDFFPIKIRTVERFVETIERRADFYRSLRAGMDKASESEADLRLAFQRVRALLPEACFQDVTLLVGCLTSSGTRSERGVLIGLEFSTCAPDSPIETLPLGNQRSVGTLSHLAPTIGHELAHSLQDQTLGGRSLLLAALVEGGAEYVSFRACGPRQPERFYITWGRSHEAEVWRDFSRAMHRDDTSRWIANNARATEEWPADLGYFVGFQIARAFHKGAQDRRATLRELPAITDPASVPERSGYADRFP